MLSSILTRLGIAILLVAMAGCATVTRGTTVSLQVESEPSGADIKLSTGQTGTTPSSFKVQRDESLTVTISKPGYETATVQVTSQIADAGAVGMAGNVVVGGIIGAGVDAVTGATKELKPNPVKVTLTPLSYYHY